MGIESDQLVYDYLSRVGDLAQQRQLPSGDRMRLVSALRNDIDRQRAKYATETPATVRRILGRFGTPEEVVETAASGSGTPYVAPPAEPEPGVPAQRDRLFPGRENAFRARARRMRRHRPSCPRRRIWRAWTNSARRASNPTGGGCSPARSGVRATPSRGSWAGWRSRNC